MISAIRNIRAIIYRLKREYGCSIIIKKPTNNAYNLETGATTRTYTSMTIRRAIVLPRKFKIDYIYDLSFVAANKNFTYGGLFGTSDVVVIVDVKDLGSFTVDETTIVTYDGHDYNIKAYELVREASIYLIRMADLES